MPRLMDMGMERLRSLLLEMGELSEKTVSTAMDAYQMGKNLAEVDRWSIKLRQLDEQVSELSIELIARFQPLASDLRYIKAGMEISYGFYRFGRYARDITQVLDMFGDISKCDHALIDAAGQKTEEMIRMSVEAFADRDVEVAKKIAEMEDAVDNMYRDYIRKLMKAKSTDLRCALSGALVLRYLERIADHATYIGNSVVYIVTGEEPAP